MTTVDNRVVQMGFDNQQFERNVGKSIDSLGSLKKSLQLEESAKSLNSLSDAGKRFSLGNVGGAVEGVALKFSALGAIGFSVLQNLTNQAINFGKKMLSQVLGPIKMGFQEYETQMNAIQTTLANTESKGTTLEDVTRVLDDLNEYSDKTIYNFTEMARNIGTFTAAGVELDTSARAIKGIANLAAVSGSNSQQAATAMYQLSQALSSGTVKLMDWNSVVNAGMGGQVFQDALKDTARVHGVAIDDMIKREGSFRNTLQNGWLSSEILLETLSKFTGDLTAEQLTTMGYTEEQIAAIIKLGQTANNAATQVKTLTQLKSTLLESMQSGWTQTWEIIIGDFDEAKVFFTHISDVLGGMISKSADSRNRILQAWKDYGGRDMLVDSLYRAFDNLLKLIEPVKNAFKEIFPVNMFRTLMQITGLISAFVDKLRIGHITALRFQFIFEGLFAIIDIGKMLVLALADGFMKLIKPLTQSINKDGILMYLARMGKNIVGIRDAIKVNDTFGVSIQKVVDWLLKAKDAVVDFIKNFKTDFPNIVAFFLALEEAVSSFAGTLAEKFGVAKEWLKEFFGNIKIDTSGLKSFFGGLGDFFKMVGQRLAPIGNFFKNIIQGIINIAKKLGPLYKKAFSIIGDVLGNIGTWISERVANTDFNKVLDVLNTMLMGGVLLAIRNFLSKGSSAIDKTTSIADKFTSILDGVKGILDGVRGSLEAWQQNLKAKTLMTIAIAIGILTLSLIALSLIDSAKLAIGLGAITVMFADLMGSLAIYDKLSGPGGKGSSLALTLIALGVSLLLLAVAVKMLSDIDKDDLVQGLGAIGALTAGILVFTKFMDKNAGSIAKSALGLLLFSVSILILYMAVKKLGNLDPDILTKGLIAVGVMLAEIAGFLQASGSGGGITVGKGLGVMAVAAALLVMIMAVEKLGKMDAEELKKGLAAIGGILLELAAFIRIAGDGKKVVLTAIGMAILGAAMILFSIALERLGELSWEELGRGLAAMAGALLILVSAMRLMPKNMIVQAIGLVIVASALLILSNALTSMGNMSWEEVGRGLLVLAGSLLILSVSMYAMKGSLGGAFALIIAAAAIAILTPSLKALGELSLLEIGIALLALAGVFLVLGVAGYVLAPVVPALMGLAIAMLLIGVAAGLVGLGLLAFSAGLAALAISGRLGATAFVAVIGILLGLIPMIITALVGAIVLFIQQITAAVPVLMAALVTILLGLIDAVMQVVPPFLEALGTLISLLLAFLVEKIPEVITTILTIIQALLDALVLAVPDFVQSGFDLLLGVLKGIADNIGEVVLTVADIITAFLDAVTLALPDIIDSGFGVLIAFVDGLATAVEENGPDLTDAVLRLGTAIVNGLVDGISNGVGAVVDAVANLAESALEALKDLLGIHSPSDETYSAGRYFTGGLINGILVLAKDLVKATKSIGNKAMVGLKTAMDEIAKTVDRNLDMTPTIRPVVDLTDIKSGGAQIGGILGKSVDLSTTMSKLAMASSGIGGDSQIIMNGGESVPSVSLTQNNYSPKPLSRYDIYKNTQNQLLTLKGMLKR